LWAEKINPRKEKCITFIITAVQDSAVNKYIKLISKEIEARIIVIAIRQIIECV